MHRVQVRGAQSNNGGLLAFKNHWVPTTKRLVYWQYPSAFLSVPSMTGK